MARRRGHFPNAEVEANLTPMIDVSFLLIIFFVLVSRIGDAEQAELAVPMVRAGAAVRAEDDGRVVLNVVPGVDGASAGYQLGSTMFEATPAGIAEMAEAIAEGYRRNSNLAVRLRADRATRYQWVEPAMRAVSTAARLAGGGALPRLDLVVEERIEPLETGANKASGGGSRNGS